MSEEIPDNAILDENGDPVRNKNGSIRKKPGPPKGTNVKAPTARKPAAKKATGGKYAESVKGLFQLATVPLVVAGQKSDAAMADVIAIGMHSDNIANAVEVLANENQSVARALDNLTKAGPYAVLVAAVVPFAIQIAANHRLVPGQVATSMGGHDPEVLAQAGKQQLQEQAQMGREMMGEEAYGDNPTE